MIGIRKVRAMALALVLTVSVLAGCTGSATQTTPTPASTPAPTAKVTTYPVTLKDDAGNSVTIAQEPKHIVSLAPSNTELLFALGKGPLLVGRTDFCDYPADVKNVPSVGSLFPPSYEKIVAAKPDLILMMGGSADVKKKLADEYKLPILTLEPKNFDELYNDIKLLGAAVNAQPQADKIVADMQAAVKEITDKTAKATAKPAAFYVASDDPIFTAGSGTFIDALITMAGGTNVGGDVKGWAQYNLEQLVAKNPAILIADNATSVDQLKAKKGWDGLQAIKTGKVYGISDWNLMTRPGPRLTQGLKWLAETIHPELFSK
ncbi:MAG TPA: ABC transporter substrate-binding protein [Symbiobacteriaceae bacterium]